jgi:hypothetical protein
MQERIRRFTVALATAGLVFSLAAPTLAQSRLSEVGEEPSAVPMIFDAAILRPIGLLTVVGGTLFYIMPVAPIMALTRPADIGKPLGPLIGAPVQFTFRDPIGYHPQRP